MKIAIVGFSGFGKSASFKAITQILIIGLAFLVGCGGVSKKTIENVLDKDPSFRKIYSSKKDIDAKILTLRNNIEKEKDLTRQHVEKLRASLRSKKHTYKKEIESLKHRLDPETQELQKELLEQKKKYRAKAKELTGLLSKLKNIQKLLEKKTELSLSGDEISVWNKRIRNLERDIITSQKKLDELRSRIHLLKIEIKILG